MIKSVVSKHWTGVF